MKKRTPLDRVSVRGRINEGAPSSYGEWVIAVANKVYELGGTDRDLAEALEVTPQTIANWHKAHAEFFETKKSKEFADARVERAMFHRAVGYDLSDGTHIPANPTSGIFWLKNRRPDRWRDRQPEPASLSDQAILEPDAVVDQLVAVATEYPQAAPRLRSLLQRALDRIGARA
jgi:hypothetical protein